MPIYPVNSANISFGRREKEKTKSKILSGAIIGAGVGAGLAQMNKIKLNPNNIGDTLTIIETKIPKTMEQNNTFEVINKKFKELDSYNQTQMTRMGLEKGTTEVPIKNVLNTVVDNKEEKTLSRLDAEIEWVKGEISAEKDSKVIAKKQAIIAEKKAMKELVESSVDGNVKTADIEGFYNSTIKNNKKIKQGLEEFYSVVKSFNKKRLGIFAAGGLVIGAFIGNMFKTKIKSKEEIINV